nr:MAG TPA: YoaP-like protein [Caudoviricetes sp.]
MVYWVIFLFSLLYNGKFKFSDLIPPIERK